MSENEQNQGQVNGNGNGGFTATNSDGSSITVSGGDPVDNLINLAQQLALGDQG